MSTQNNQDSSDRFTLKIAGLFVADEQKTSLEKAADDMADKVDAARTGEDTSGNHTPEKQSYSPFFF